MHRRNRGFVAAIVGVVIAFATAVAQSGLTPSDDYPDLGKDGASFLRCLYKPILRCEGFRKDGLSARGNDNESLKWLHSRKWEEATGLLRRRAAVTTATPVYLTIAAISSPEKIAFRELDHGGMLVAKIEADPEAAGDTLYPIGGHYTQKKNFSGRFYLFTSKYDPTAHRAQDVSKEITKVFVYGVKATNPGARDSVIVQLGEAISFRQCKHSHDREGQYRGAFFQGCELKRKIAAIDAHINAVPAARDTVGSQSVLNWLASQQPRNAASTPNSMLSATWAVAALNKLAIIAKLTEGEKQAVLDALDESQFAPAWVTCGIGCCTAGT